MKTMATREANSARLAYSQKLRQWLPDLRLGFENLLIHKLRSLLTMLGMIFGVAAVVSMLSIGAGAQQKVMAFIEQLGVRNLIVEAKEANNYQELQKVRRTSPGLTFGDCRMLRTGVQGVEDSSPRKRFTPTTMIPKPDEDVPMMYGVGPTRSIRYFISGIQRMAQQCR